MSIQGGEPKAEAALRFLSVASFMILEAHRFRNEAKVAILLGAFNAGSFLEQQIQSIRTQSYQDWCLYIRDDASTDKTRAVIEKCRAEDSRIVLIADDEGNLGCNGNYFRLLSAVDSQYYMFSNADDVWFPDKVELSLRRMAREERVHPGAAIIVHTDLAIADRHLHTISRSYWVAVNTDPEKLKSYGMLGVCNVVAGATMLFNQLAKNVAFPVHPSAPFFDHWMALRVVPMGLIASVHKATMLYRQTGANLCAVSVGVQDSIWHKMSHLGQVIAANRKEALMLRRIGWGGMTKYLLIKILVLLTLRCGGRYEPSRYVSLD